MVDIPKYKIQNFIKFVLFGWTTMEFKSLQFFFEDSKFKEKTKIIR